MNLTFFKLNYYLNGDISFYYYLNLKIMVRTTRLCQVLGRILGRALGRQVSGDAEEGSQRRKPTILAHREQAHAAVVEDFENVDNAADKVHEKSHDPFTDHVATDTKGFPDGSQDTSVLKDYAYHVAVKVWAGEILASHGRKVEKFGRHAPKIEGTVAATRLSSLITCSLDKGLLSAFAERWHKETNSFHLLIGEVTITIDDVVSSIHTFDAIDVEEVVDLLVESLEVTTQEEKDETDQCRGAYWTIAARAYLLHLVRCTLFASESATHISVAYLDTLRDLSQFGGYSWGVVALVYMYDNLNVASKHTTKHLAGYITLLQDYHERKPQACCRNSRKALPVMTYQKHLDRLMSNIVCWIPYGDRYAFREFELISLFSGHLRWGSTIVRHQPWRVCAANYMEWRFYRISYPFMSVSQLSDPSRHPLVVHDDTFILPDPPMLPIQLEIMPQPYAHATVDADMPHHAVATCQRIAKSFENMINMMMVTVGIDAYTQTDHCL
ncbi:Protein MAIN-LIKE 1 [Glycine soja]